MTVALAVLVAALAVALALVAARQAQAARRHDQQLAEAVADKEAAGSRLAEVIAAAELLEHRLKLGQEATQAAERLRLQREWAELAGPGVALPVEWDGSLACAVGSELEIIREIAGTPGTMEVDGDGGAPSGFRLALGAEFLRAAALDADEMHVKVGDRLVVQASSGTSGIPVATPHLDAIARLVNEAGGDVTVEVSESGFTATLTFGD